MISEEAGTSVTPGETTLQTGGQKTGLGIEKRNAVTLYDPTGKIDPFKSFIAEQEEIQEKKKRKPKTYLETLDLSQLILTAIIVGPNGHWAMVRDSKGTGHVIRKGTYIGINGGTVHQITDKEVIVREEYTDIKGQVQHRDIKKEVPPVE
ncbi:MAG: pilus assembly protein PilP [Desulfatiglandales bacterium]